MTKKYFVLSNGLKYLAALLLPTSKTAILHYLTITVTVADERKGQTPVLISLLLHDANVGHCSFCFQNSAGANPLRKWLVSRLKKYIGDYFKIMVRANEVPPASAEDEAFLREQGVKGTTGQVAKQHYFHIDLHSGRPP